MSPTGNGWWQISTKSLLQTIYGETRRDSGNPPLRRSGSI